MLSRDVEPIGIGGLLLRRAVLGTLLAAGRALTAKEIAEALRQSGATTRPTLTKGPSRVIADLLAHQVRAGKVLKTGPGTFAVAPDRMSRSTRFLPTRRPFARSLGRAWRPKEVTRSQQLPPSPLVERRTLRRCPCPPHSRSGPQRPTMSTSW